MIPISISKKMMYNTIRLESNDGSCGTGSYFNFNIRGQIIPVIITNKHVVNYNCDEEITYRTKWIFHSNKDLCSCYINPLFEEIKRRYNKNVYMVANDEAIIYKTQKLNELSALEELVMVGYPIGLWDEKNNLPIFRKGYTANHPAIDFNEKGIVLIDMSCFPGSSGSSIYILNEGGYKDKNGNTFLGNSRVILLGYLFACPQYKATGELEVENIPTQQKVIANTPIMANLGYYAKAYEIMKFKKQIESDLN